MLSFVKARRESTRDTQYVTRNTQRSPRGQDVNRKTSIIAWSRKATADLEVEMYHVRPLVGSQEAADLVLLHLLYLSFRERLKLDCLQLLSPHQLYSLPI